MPGGKIVKARVELLELIGEEEVFRRYLEDCENQRELLNDVFEIHGEGRAPGHHAFYQWLDSVEGRRERWRGVKRMKADQHFDKSIEAAETATSDNVQVRKLQHSAHKWAAGVMDRDQYGQGPQVVNNNNTFDANDFGLMIANALNQIAEDERKVIPEAIEATVEDINEGDDDDA